SAGTAERCAALTDLALAVDPSVMPMPGPAAVAWRSADGRAALLHWGDPGSGSGSGSSPVSGLSEAAGTSRAGTIRAGEPRASRIPIVAPIVARTSVTRIDPVYLAEVPGAAIVADRATWAAWTASRLGDHDPLHVCALLNSGFPLGSVTPFAGVAAVGPSTTLHLLDGAVTRPATPAYDKALPGARGVAEALTAAVLPLREADTPVQVSLTGGKDSRLIAAALVKAGVPVTAKTHGFDDHPDVVVAAEIARRLGIEHVVRTPAAPGQRVDVLARIRATVLVADGMLSAFENVGRPDPTASPALTAGGHGGELLRGGYAETAGRAGARGGLRAVLSPARRAARSAELLRRLTTKHLGLVRRGPAAAYAASLVPWTAPLALHPLQALDDFYLVNRAGRWSAAARQAYLLRERLTQPLFDDRVVCAARTVPLADRVSGALPAAVLAELNPALTDVPLAGKPAAAAAPFDWRRQYGESVTTFLRGYILDLGLTGGLFDVLSQPAVEKVLTPPHADRATVWALATAACLLSGDYRKAREKTAQLTVA
ncbi:MAG TPA: asparagine synthase-related protein, partial [Trebonia sp.]|nr:asparagine synthase-related protein [Trebonia sp.]